MNTPEAIATRLIGALFVERGLVSEGQLRVALELQRETGAQLGQILVEKFGVSRKELTRVVADQWREMHADPGPGPDADPGQTWRPLGEIFVTRGFVSEEELDNALRRQRKTGERLGEALVALGVISKFELAGALGEQMATLQETESAEATGPAPVVQLHERLSQGSSYGQLDEPSADVVDDDPGQDPEPFEFEDVAPDAAEVAVAAEDVVVEEDVAEAEELAEELEPPVLVEPEPELVADLVAEPIGESAAMDAEPEPEATWEPEPAFEESADLESPELVAELLDEAARTALDVGQTVGDEMELVGDPSLERAVCLAYASTPQGYRLVSLPVELPSVGETIDVPEVGEVVVLRVGASPLPSDRRVCVYVEQPLSPADALLPI